MAVTYPLPADCLNPLAELKERVREGLSHGKPLLVVGPPGCGKVTAAEEVLASRGFRRYDLEFAGVPELVHEHGPALVYGADHLSPHYILAFGVWLTRRRLEGTTVLTATVLPKVNTLVQDLCHVQEWG